MLFGEGGFEVEYSHKLPSATVSVNMDYLGRVIDNVFSNLQKYADVNAPVCIESGLEDGKLMLSVKNKIDEGADRAESNGIGLKTCERIMERMSGNVFVRSENGEFSITLSFPIK